MTLYKKAILVITLLITGVVVLIFILSTAFLLSSYTQLQHSMAQSKLQSIRLVIDNELRYLDSTTGDWSNWNDTFEYAKGNNPKYVEENLPDNTFISLKLNLIYITDNDGNIIHGEWFDQSKKTRTTPPEHLEEFFSPDSPIMRLYKADGRIHGVTDINGTPLLLVGHPILDSNGNGPSAGIIFFGILGDEYFTTRLSELTQTDLRMTVYHQQDTETDRKLLKNFPNQGFVVNHDDTNEGAKAATLIGDAFGQPHFLLETWILPGLYNEIQQSIRFSGFTLLLFGAMAAFLIIWLAKRLVLNRINKLSKQVNDIAVSANIEYHIDMDGRDDIYQLASQINKMLHTIRSVQNDLTENEIKHRLLLNSIPNSIVALDEELRILYCNDAYAGFVGREPYQMEGHSIRELFHEFINTESYLAYERVLETGHTEEVEGRFGNTILRATVMRTPWGVLALSEDVTKRRRTEEALQRSRKSFESLFELSKSINQSLSLDDLLHRISILLADNSGVLCGAIYFADNDAKVIHTMCSFGSQMGSIELTTEIPIKNPEVMKILGANESRIIKEDAQKVFLRDVNGTAPVEGNLLAFHLKSANESVGILLMLLTKYDQETLTFLEMVSSELSTGIRNKLAIKKLAEDELFSRAIIDNSTIGISVRSHTGQLLMANKAWKKIWNKSEEEYQNDLIRRRTVLQFDEKDSYLADYQDEIARVYSQGGDFFIPAVATSRRKTKVACWLSQYFYALKDSQGVVDKVVILTVDITEQKRSEQIQDAVGKIANAALMYDNLADLNRSVHEILTDIIYAPNFVIALYDEQTEMVTASYFVDEHDDFPPPRKLGNAVVDHIIRTGEPVYWQPGQYAEVIRKLGLQPIGTPSISWLGIPLKTKDRLIGVLVVQSYRDDAVYGEVEKNILMFVSTQIAMAIERISSEAKLHASNEINSAVIEHSPLAITIRESTGKLIGYNNTWLNMWKITEEELELNTREGRTLHEAFGFLNEWFDSYKRLCHEGGYLYIPEFRTTIERSDKPQWVSYHFYAIKDDTGRVTQVVNLTQDISERKYAETLRNATFKITEASSSANTIDELFVSIHQILGELIYVTNFYIALYDEEKDSLSFPYYVDENAPADPPPRKMGTGLTDYIIRTGETVLYSDGKQDESMSKLGVQPYGAPAHSWLGVPLVITGKVKGVLAIQSYNPQVNFGETERKILDFVSNQIAMVIERKQAENSLRESEEKFRQLAESIHEVFWIRDFSTRELLYMSPSYEDLTGIPVAVLFTENEGSVNTTHPDDRVYVEQAMEQQYIDGHFSEEYRICRVDGSIRWVRSRSYPITNEDGQIVRIAGVAEDITQKKRIEKVQNSIYTISEATNTEENLQSLYRAIQNALGELMPVDNFFIALHQDGSDMIDFPYYIDQHDTPPGSRKLANGYTEYVLKTGEPLLAQAEDFPVLQEKYDIEMIGLPAESWLGIPLNTRDTTIGVMVVQSYSEGFHFGEEERDILVMVSHQVAMAIERKRAEQALRDSNTFNQAIIEHSPLGISVRDKYGALINYNQTWLRLWNFSPKEMLRIMEEEASPCSIEERFSFINDHIEGVKRVFTDGGYVHVSEIFTGEMRPGAARWVSYYIYSLSNKDGQVERVVTLTEDISERKQAEINLERERKAFFVIAEASVNARSIPELCQHVLDGLADSLGFELGVVSIYNPMQETFDAIAMHCSYDEIERETVLKTFSSITEKLMITRQIVSTSVFCESAEHDTLLNLDSEINTGSMLAIPMFTNQKDLLGVLQLANISSDILLNVEPKFLETVAGMFANALERKRAEEEVEIQRNYFQQLFENTPIGILLIDRSSNIINVNNSFGQIFGYAPEEIVGRNMDEFVDFLFTDSDDSIASFETTTNSVVEHEAERKHKNGNTIHVHVMGVPIIVGQEHMGLFAIYLDVTERVMAAESLRKAKDELEKANLELRQLDQMKTEFLNITSHELKTPLTSIIGYSELLCDDVLGPVAPPQRKAVDGILRNTRQLKRLVEDLLEFSRMENRTMKLELEFCDIESMVLENVDSLSGMAEEANCALKTDVEKGLPMLLCDPRRITQVLYNLIVNAIKFSPNGGDITISAKAGEHSFLISVADHGLGIAPEDQEKVFEKFYQADMSEVRMTSGMGLGLAISRGIVEAHGGTIWVESVKGKGSTFSFTMPYKESLMK